MKKILLLLFSLVIVMGILAQSTTITINPANLIDPGSMNTVFTDPVTGLQLKFVSLEVQDYGNCQSPTSFVFQTNPQNQSYIIMTSVRLEIDLSPVNVNSVEIDYANMLPPGASTNPPFSYPTIPSGNSRSFLYDAQPASSIDWSACVGTTGVMETMSLENPLGLPTSHLGISTCFGVLWEVRITLVDQNVSVSCTTIDNCPDGNNFNINSTIFQRGSIFSSVTGGTSPYTYLWDDGNTDANRMHMVPGTYYLTVTDAAGLVGNCTAVVASFPAISLSGVVTDETFLGTCDGAIDLTVAGGTPAPGTPSFGWIWSSGDFTEDISGLCPGQYNVTVHDNASCFETDSFIVNSGSGSLQCPSNNQFNVALDANGNMIPALTGGTDYYPGGVNGWYEYPTEWDNIWFCNLPFDSTAYKEIVVSAFIDQLDPTVPFFVEFTVNWSTPAWDTVNFTEPPVPGNMGNFLENEVIVRQSVLVTDNLADLGLIVDSFIIPEYCPGWVSIDVRGFNFIVTNGAIHHECMSEPLGQCCYVDNCDIFCDYTTLINCNSLSGVWNPTATCNDPCPQIPFVIDNVLISNVSCNGGSDGVIEVLAIGGAIPYTYLWTPTMPVGGPVLTGLSAGTYTLVVLDANGCSIIGTYVVTEPLAITLSLSSVDASCYGYNDGSATVVAAGGTTPYSYSWGADGTTSTITELYAGTYSVVVTDANGCTATGFVIVNEPLELILSIAGTNPSYAGASDGSADLSVSGGTPSYVYYWDIGSSSEDISGLSAGTYCVSVYDVNQCVGTGCVILIDPAGCPTYNDFWVEVQANGWLNPNLTGGTNYYGGSSTGWYEYPSGWNNIWFCNLPFDSTGYKEIIVTTYLNSFLEPLPLSLEFSICWSTPAWDTIYLSAPPLQSLLTSVSENQAIVRQTVLATNTSNGLGSVSYSLTIPDYCPGWVSIGVRGFNFKVTNGMIHHECLSDSLGQCCYVDASGVVGCVENTEIDCGLIVGSWNASLTCNDDCTLPVPWIDPGNTGDNHSILFSVNSTITIDGIPADVGDGLAVFYEDGGVSYCGGYIIWQQDQTALVAWGDDTQTVDKDGFAVGEIFSWKVWDASEGIEYDAIAVYDASFLDEGEYANNGLSAIISIEALSCQSIALNSGWGLVSTYIDPIDPDLAVMTAELDSGNLVIMKNENGIVFFPAFSLNMIGDWLAGEAYQINVTNPDTLTICGQILNPAATGIFLPGGWGLFGYLCQWPMPIVQMLAPIENDIVIVKNEDGLVYWVYFGLDQIGDMTPGKGYQVKMYDNTSNTLYYQCNATGSTKSEMINYVPEHFISPKSTGNSMTIGIPDFSWNNTPDIGDEIGVFNQIGELVGSTVYIGGHSSITLWGDDELTEHTEMLSVDEEFDIQLWRSITGRTEVLKVNSWEEGDNRYEINKISIAERVILSDPSLENYILYQNVPNPFRDNTEIRFYLPENSQVTISVYSILGEKVTEVYDGAFDRGIHSIEFNSSELSPGSYFYRLTTPNFTGTMSMSIIR